MTCRPFARAAGASTALALGLVLGLAPAATASVSATPDVTAQAAGTVYALAQAGDRTIVGGAFTRFGGRTRGNLAAVLPGGGVDPAFTPSADGVVYAAAVSEDGSRVFVGGTFTTVGGVPRANLAALDATTGAVIADWQADTAGAYPEVKSLAVKGSRLYVGGRFTAIDGTTRKRLVALDVTTGQVVTSFKPAPNGNVREVVVSPDGTKVYAGGAFTVIGGQSRPAAAAELSSATGLATAFAPSVGGGNAVTVEISADGSRFFLANENNTVIAYDPAVSNDPVWSRKFSGNTQAMASSAGGELYLGGHFVQDVTSKSKRPFFASITVADGALTPWAPAATGGKLGVWALLTEGTHVHSGGVFDAFGGVKQHGYARFSGTP